MINKSARSRLAFNVAALEPNQKKTLIPGKKRCVSDRQFCITDLGQTTNEGRPLKSDWFRNQASHVSV
jgi:hypothetical protein